MERLVPGILAAVMIQALSGCGAKTPLRMGEDETDGGPPNNGEIGEVGPPDADIGGADGGHPDTEPVGISECVTNDDCAVDGLMPFGPHSCCGCGWAECTSRGQCSQICADADCCFTDAGCTESCGLMEVECERSYECPDEHWCFEGECVSFPPSCTTDGDCAVGGMRPFVPGSCCGCGWVECTSFGQCSEICAD